jgi:centromere protein S
MLKSSLWYSVGKIVDNESLNLHVNATPQFIGTLTEMVFAQAGMSIFRTELMGV